MMHSKNSLFQQKFHNCTDSTEIPNLGVRCKSDPVGFPESESDKISDP